MFFVAAVIIIMTVMKGSQVKEDFPEKNVIIRVITISMSPDDVVSETE